MLFLAQHGILGFLFRFLFAAGRLLHAHLPLFCFPRTSSSVTRVSHDQCLPRFCLALVFLLPISSPSLSLPFAFSPPIHPSVPQPGFRWTPDPQATASCSTPESGQVSPATTAGFYQAQAPYAHEVQIRHRRAFQNTRQYPTAAPAAQRSRNMWTQDEEEEGPRRRSQASAAAEGGEQRYHGQWGGGGGGRGGHGHWR